MAISKAHPSFLQRFRFGKRDVASSELNIRQAPYLFDESHRSSPIGFRLAAIAATVLVFSQVILAIDWVSKDFFHVLTSRPFLTQVAVNSAAIAASIIAAYIYGLVGVENEDRKKLEKLRSIGDPRMIQSILNYTAQFNGRWMRDCNIIIRLLPHSTRQDVLICRMEYHYRKVLINGDLDFQISKSGPQPQADRPLRLTDDIVSASEYYYVLDESGFSNASELASLYQVSSLIVDSDVVPLQHSTDSASSQVLQWTARLPDHRKPLPCDYVLMYQVQFPLELDSYLYTFCEFPTFGLTVRFDYSQVKDRIMPSMVEFVSPKDGMGYPQVDDEQGNMSIAHSSWVMPKSGIMFVWYQRSN